MITRRREESLRSIIIIRRASSRCFDWMLLLRALSGAMHGRG